MHFNLAVENRSGYDEIKAEIMLAVSSQLKK